MEEEWADGSHHTSKSMHPRLMACVLRRWRRGVFEEILGNLSLVLCSNWLVRGCLIVARSAQLGLLSNRLPDAMEDPTHQFLLLFMQLIWVLLV